MFGFCLNFPLDNCHRVHNNHRIAWPSHKMYDWILIGSVALFRAFDVDLRIESVHIIACGYWLLLAHIHRGKKSFTHINDQEKKLHSNFLSFFFSNTMLLLLICWLFIALVSLFQSIKKLCIETQKNVDRGAREKYSWENKMYTGCQRNRKRAKERERTTENHQQI